MSDKLSCIDRLELKPPLDPFTFDAKNPERAFSGYDPVLAKKHEPNPQRADFNYYGIPIKL